MLPYVANPMVTLKQVVVFRHPSSFWTALNLRRCFEALWMLWTSCPKETTTKPTYHEQYSSCLTATTVSQAGSSKEGQRMHTYHLHNETRHIIVGIMVACLKVGLGWTIEICIDRMSGRQMGLELLGLLTIHPCPLGYVPIRASCSVISEGKQRCSSGGSPFDFGSTKE